MNLNRLNQKPTKANSAKSVEQKGHKSTLADAGVFFLHKKMTASAPAVIDIVVRVVALAFVPNLILKPSMAWASDRDQGYQLSRARNETWR